MSVYLQRDAALLVDAIHWKGRVIAGYIARGEVLVSPADTIRRALNRNELPISARQGRRLAKFLEVRGHAASLLACTMAGGQTSSSHV
jgi:hypothetical protein